ncbi:glycosyltransferase family 2 protein [Shimia thalassica]|uniref:Glycosyl transferase family 2 n=1 Tax=Shimia thalassica TaxID=1715693 RepID=A0A0P1INF7_9RHOB|nr:glycosyltransferase family 2 protein [Shimia thalassica]PHO05566.1 glycosyltransferase family 2 protein [Rhodobacteraceae bacterium 4F10]MBU2944961.1 glycosyltransferase family 2 protein [Shimia thalassica]MDO6481164.1 glycosyltransferase family 2 protein [Shimia thalassica]MDO6484927.1 glycosyltransferase family 2 protein [Shimia thalassica]MDO6504731.1 glycosyltransferase family 2 protein [Shimia thalassica]
MGFWTSYRLRIQRRRWLVRALRKRRELRAVSDRSNKIKSDDLLLFSTLRNEHVRLPYFLNYYREQGINHFLIVDNDSNDGSLEYLAEQPDVSVWHSKHSYKKSRFGVDWLNWLQFRYGHDHWCLVVDPDEFLIYPFCDTRPLRALTDWLDASSIKSFSAMLLDMYPKGRLDEQPYRAGQNPMEIASWFDAGNYTMEKNAKFGNLWIQGGPRSRVFFPHEPEKAPALNKIPLVKWNRRYAYVSSTHMVLPRGLNQVYDEWGGEKASGILLHAKFLDTFSIKAAEELQRKQHYAASIEYLAYAQSLSENPELWCKWSEKYINWRQLEILGLMSKGNWA